MLLFGLVAHILAVPLIGPALCGAETAPDAPLPPGRIIALKPTPLRQENPTSVNYSVRFVGKCDNRGEEGVVEESRRKRSGRWWWWRRLLRALDRAILADSVRIADGVFLVKDDDGQSFRTAAAAAEEEEEEEEYENGVGWANLAERLLRRLIVLLETHAIRVRVGTMTSTPSTPAESGRIGGHGYRHAFPLMVGSFALLAAFFVPLGFQFLAVVAGKALVLSQIAILVAMAGSIQRYFGQRGVYGPPSGVAQHEYHHHQLATAGVDGVGGAGYGYWHRGDSNPEPLGPSRLQAYLTDTSQPQPQPQ